MTGTSYQLDKEYENSYLHLWGGYEETEFKEQDVLEKTFEISIRKSQRVSYGTPTAAGRPRGYISTIKLFGKEPVEDATHILVRGMELPIVRADKRVEITKHFPKIRPGDRVYVNLLETDRIPITTLNFSAYVRGIYPRTIPHKRDVYVRGSKDVVLGIRPPKEESPTEFWDSLFEEFELDLIHEFKEGIIDEHEFPGPDIVGKGVYNENWIWKVEDPGKRDFMNTLQPESRRLEEFTSK